MQLGDRCRRVKDQAAGLVIGRSKNHKDGCRVLLLDEGTFADLKLEAVSGPDGTITTPVLSVFNVDPERLTKGAVQSAVFWGNMQALGVLAIIGVIFYLLNHQ
jgi:hypothetical protein